MNAKLDLSAFSSVCISVLPLQPLDAHVQSASSGSQGDKINIALSRIDSQQRNINSQKAVMSPTYYLYRKQDLWRQITFPAAKRCVRRDYTVYSDCSSLLQL